MQIARHRSTTCFKESNKYRPQLKWIMMEQEITYIVYKIRSIGATNIECKGQQAKACEAVGNNT